INGKVITDKLIARKNILAKESLKYYKFISHDVNVLGSNESEYFRISKSNGDSIKLVVYSLRKKADTSFVMYQRVFDPHVTREVRMYGFNGDDKFQLDSGLHSSISFRIIGGKGNDTVLIKSPIKTFVYDNTTEKNYLERSRRTVKVYEDNPRAFDYQLNNFNYPVKRFPRILAGSNADDGFLLGTGFNLINYGFRKVPYASSHKLIALFAVSRKAFQIKYNGELIHALGKTDFLINAGITNPVLNNFYGFGNTTKLDPTKPISFYRVRYKEIQGEFLLRKRYFDKLSFIAGPTFYRYWNEEKDNKDYILAKPSEAGLDSGDVYKSKLYAGAKLAIELDNLNNDLFPTRGIRWTNRLTLLQPLNKNANGLNKIESDMVIYASLKIPAKVVGVIKLGGGHIFNDSVDYFQALSLGANNVLRGFRKNRFSGHSVAYGSLELRIKLFDSHSYIFPGQVGAIVFNDIGRVWYKGEDSKKWHNVIGGGFYYNPFNIVIMSFTVGYSPEEQVLNFSLGSKFNLTF
ncbi:MAG: BamA/TamA family outer membrane protein, partial [Chitinophagaceae bacterium]